MFNEENKESGGVTSPDLQPITDSLYDKSSSEQKYDK